MASRAFSVNGPGLQSRGRREAEGTLRSRITLNSYQFNPPQKSI